MAILGAGQGNAASVAFFEVDVGTGSVSKRAGEACTQGLEVGSYKESGTSSVETNIGVHTLQKP